MKKNLSYSSAFPTPRFLSMPTLGVDISDENIKYLSFSYEDTGLEVKQYGKVNIPKGVLNAGAIENEQKFIDTLKIFKEETKAHFVRLALPEEQVYLFETSLPIESTADMRSAIEFKLPEYVPLELSDIIFDFDVVHQNQNTIHVQVAATRRIFVEKYLNALQSAGLEPLSFEIEAQSIARSVVSKGDKDTYMVVDFGRTRTGISIVSHGLVLFTSTLSVGGNSILEDITKNTELKKEEIEKLKKKKGIVSSTENPIFSILQKNINTLADEVQKHYVYWTSQQGYPDSSINESLIKAVVLCGGEANIPGIPKFFEDKLDVPVVIPNVWQNANSMEEYVPPLTKEDSLAYATAIGLALGDIEYD